MSQQLQDLKEDQVLDTRGLLCPMPVVKVSQVIRGLTSGQVLKILATDPGSKADMPAWAEATGNPLLRQETDKGIYVYWIRKG